MHVRKLVSDKPLLIDDPTPDEIKSPVEWTMPEPVFRSSKGHTPNGGTTVADGEDEALVDTDPDMGNVIDPDEDISDEKTIEIVGDATKAKVQPKRGCLSKFLYLILGITLLIAAAIFALIYFFYYAVRTTDGLN